MQQHDVGKAPTRHDARFGDENRLKSGGLSPVDFGRLVTIFPCPLSTSPVPEEDEKAYESNIGADAELRALRPCQDNTTSVVIVVTRFSSAASRNEGLHRREHKASGIRLASCLLRLLKSTGHSLLPSVAVQVKVGAGKGIQCSRSNVP